MENGKSVEKFKASDGFLVAEILIAENGKFRLLERRRNDLGTGNRHSIIGEYDEIDHAKSEAKVIVEKYEQDQMG